MCDPVLLEPHCSNTTAVVPYAFVQSHAEVMDLAVWEEETI